MLGSRRADGFSETDRSLPSMRPATIGSQRRLDPALWCPPTAPIMGSATAVLPVASLVDLPATPLPYLPVTSLDLSITSLDLPVTSLNDLPITALINLENLFEFLVMMCASVGRFVGADRYCGHRPSITTLL
jgi:hypothetical protein